MLPFDHKCFGVCEKVGKMAAKSKQETLAHSHVAIVGRKVSIEQAVVLLRLQNRVNNVRSIIQQAEVRAPSMS